MVFLLVVPIIVLNEYFLISYDLPTKLIIEL